VYDQLSPEMRELYQNAQEFIEMGQETHAINCFELILHQAEEISNQSIIDFIKRELDNLYK